MILVRSPLRVSLFGGGTDYPEWYREHGGAVLGMAINKYVYVGVKRMPPGQAMRYRVQYSKVNDCLELGEIAHPAVKGALRHLGIDEPLEFHIFADLPGRSGLGGSSACAVCLLRALRGMFRPPELMAPVDLAAEAIYLEREMIREAVGCQDQIFAARGGLNFIEFLSDRTPNRDLYGGWMIDPLRLAEERETLLAESLVLVYSGTMRDVHVMAARQVAAIPQHLNTLESMTALAKTAKNVLFDQRQPLDELGRMLDWSWKMKRGLHAEMAPQSVDDLYRRAVGLGALGGKLCGAGGGGFMLFYVPPERRAGFEKRIGAPCVRFKIAPQGVQVIVEEA